MRTIMILIGISLIWCRNSWCQELKKLDYGKVASEKIDLAKKFANDYLNASKNGSYYKFGNEAIEQIKNQLTPESQKTVYNQMKEQFGDFQSLDYAETWIQEGNSSMNIIRLKGRFDKSSSPIEIRVVLDGSNKISGFWFKPWSDNLN